MHAIQLFEQLERNCKEANDQFERALARAKTLAAEQDRLLAELRKCSDELAPLGQRQHCATAEELAAAGAAMANASKDGGADCVQAS